MAVDKLVDSTQLDADLTSVANAIRTKGGTSAQLAFPAGFVSAIGSIPSGPTPTGTKQISITQNGTTTEDVTNYASAEITVNVSGGGGPDLSGIKQAESLNNIGGLFQAMIDGTWGYVEKSFTSGTNPLTVNFGRAVKGWLCYPKSITVVSGLTGECTAIGIAIYNPTPNEETGAQSLIWSAYRGKSATGAYPLPRISGSGSLTNGVFSATPSYPSNQNYHPFGFNKPYIFVYWW